MKKSLIALAVLAASGAAMAQSSVTLYGVIDSGLTYVSGVDNVYGLTNAGGNVNSRLGFRGTEDLGNGLKANFNLESGFSPDDGTNYMGQNGLAFTRTATVGLAGSFGEVRLGRMLTSSYLAVSRYDAFGDTGIGASRAWAKNTDSYYDAGAGATVDEDFGYTTRASNAISYTSANYNGFKFGAEYGFGEQKKARDARYLGLAGTYDNGPLSLGLGFDRQNGTKGVAGATDDTTWQLGGAYNFGVAKLMAFYKQTKYKDIAANESGKFKTFGLGVTAPVGAVGEVRASYNHYRLSGDAGVTPKADQLSLGYVHNLSKRTALYGTASYITNKKKGGSDFALNAGGLKAGLKTNGGKQGGVQVGVRHAF